MTHPITPNEARQLKKSSIPPEVIKIWNTLIVENLRGKTSKFSLKTLTSSLCSGLDKTLVEIKTSGYEDLEYLYEQAGWKVKYDQPSYDERYEAHFTFTMPE